MKKIFLFDPTCLPYRIHVYEYFIEQFEKEGYELKVYYDPKQTNIKRQGFGPVRYSFVSFLKLHISEKPDVSIFFIWLRYKFSLPFLLFCRLFLRTKLIVWCKGVNLSKSNQPIINQLYYLRQRIAHALILYSDFEKRFIRTNPKKIFVANNTINQHKYSLHNNKIENLKDKYNIKQNKVVLFLGRIQKRKRVDILIDIFRKRIKNHALVIVGPGMSKEMQDTIKPHNNIYYMGPIYDLNILSEIYSLSDIFCIPGEIGLGINEAFLFGLPVVTTFIRPTAEMNLLFRENINGLLFEKDNELDLTKKLCYLLENDKVYEKFSQKAFESFINSAKIEYMFEGFLNAVNYVKQLKWII